MSEDTMGRADEIGATSLMDSQGHDDHRAERERHGVRDGRPTGQGWPLEREDTVSPMDITQVTQELELMRKRRYAAEEQARRLAVDLQHPGMLLNFEQCE